MFTSIIVLAAAIGFMNILFIIYSTFSSRRRLRKDQYTLVPVRASKQVVASPAPEPIISEVDLSKDYIADGVLLYSKEELLAEKFSRVERNSRMSSSVSAPEPARFSMADFR